MYDYQWARGVVDKLWRTYPRASDSVSNYFGISSKTHAYLLAQNSPGFYVLKKVIKRAGQFLDTPGITRKSGGDVRFVLTNVIKMLTNSQIQLLTEAFTCPMLKKQGLRGY